jgi:hypothetical protein
MISSKDWFSFSIDGQSNGVFARESIDGSSFFDVILLKGCTMNSHGGCLMLRFQTMCCRVIKPEMEDLMICETKEQRAHENDVNTHGVLPSTMIYLPTGEGVTVAKYNSYRGVLTSDTMTPSTSSSKQKKKTNNDNETICSNTHLLTELDIKNRLRGYSLFLPSSKEKCDEYWRMTHGIQLHDDTDDDNVREVPLAPVLGMYI